MSLPNNENIVVLTISFHIHSDRTPPSQLLLPLSSTVRVALNELTEKTGIIFIESDGILKPHYIVILNGVQIDLLQGLDTILASNSTMAVLSVIHGGLDET